MKVFKDCGFRIIIQANLRTINFLYIQINLDTSTHHSNRKLDNNPFYLNKNSKHPTTVLKQLPKLIKKHISDISSKENIFIQSIIMYQDTLQKSAFT